jgi:hypothetical protein
LLYRCMSGPYVFPARLKSLFLSFLEEAMHFMSISDSDENLLHMLNACSPFLRVLAAALATGIVRVEILNLRYLTSILF